MQRSSRLARTCAALALAAGLAACAAPGAGPSNQISTEDIARVQRGMSQEEVRKLLGEPTLTDRLGRGRGDVWTYNYIDRSLPTPHMQLFVWFDPATGKVTRTESGFNRSFDPGGN